ncbi:c-type cytochrome [Bradyrhizobium sp. INPA01-394B]|uniref:FTR1 family protein n=1 Tax=Bradyrhizobium campsiandrae TaxID=1729892 RepID=A0ABR7UHU7_9BRAD|nr:FTR1 family protein [Bradyrhizobium campsiandrae]MBC9882312.1 c-type cytochrome [Bradyrhizobium campsiandrae]MBC9983205.1 FTR1 family protein [Bradyrhizobium campsiandrae]
MNLISLPVRLGLLFILMAFVFLGKARAETSDVETTWRLLDYIAVDYPGAVSHGSISSPSEYAEQKEFAATIAAKLAALPPKPEQEALLTEAGRLQRAIESKAEAEQVAEIAHGLATSLLAAYPVPLAPKKVPNFARGAALFAQNCASCHDATGDGQGPDAAKLNTPPVAFTDADRSRQRSVFALYLVITQGLDGTPMPSFDGLPADDRWALAFYAGHFAFSDAAATEGERLWKQDEWLHGLVPDLKALAGTTPASLAGKIGEDKADALMAYLRRHPEVLGQQTGSLSLVRGRLAESLAFYRAGDRQRAAELALSAYLDGFEPVEPTLAARDRALMERIEDAMGEYRATIQSRGTVDALTDRAQILDVLLDDADAALSPDAASGLSTFLGAATILLREGLEALLIVVAMIAFLRKAERMEVMRYVHAGWVSALAAGFLTWIVATWMIGISGASRELTEGFGSVFASVVLLSVGIWMHGKAQADQWQHYIREKMAKALSGGSAWFLFGLAFIVVYREVFETILFFAALWNQGNGGAILAGTLSACLTLAVVAWAMLRFSRRLPIGKFFTYSSWLMAVLTVVLAGKGIAALQEAGMVSIAPLRSVPRISLVGLFPTTQTVAAQVLVIAALAIGFALNRRKVA